MNNIKYAPVAIPTLNRYDHFRECLESLERCTGAENTEIFVALDYPPSPKYEVGWNKIDAYLHEKEKSNGFKKLNVIRRDHNYGVWKADSNAPTLENEVLEKFDSYIFTEDDNVFSPNALEYFNKGLEKFQNDNSIFAISGYDWGKEKPLREEETYYKSKSLSAWGLARWKHKQALYESKYNSLESVKSMLVNKATRKQMILKSPSSIGRYLNMLKSDQLWGDALMVNYMALEDKYCIYPKVSLIRNLGCDGTGEHNKEYDEAIANMFANQLTSNEKHFEFIGDGKIIAFVNPRTSPLKDFIKTLICRLDLFTLSHLNYLSKSRYI